MTEEKFYKENSADETLREAIINLDEANFNFAQFVSNFKRYLEKIEKLNSN